MASHAAYKDLRSYAMALLCSLLLPDEQTLAKGLRRIYNTSEIHGPLAAAWLLAQLSKNRR